METNDTPYNRLGDYDANRRTMLTALVAGAFAEEAWGHAFQWRERKRVRWRRHIAKALRNRLC